MTDKHPQDGPADPSPALMRAIRHLLRPLVRFLVARGITYPMFSTMLKSIFVDVAEKDFKLPNKQQTDSRINLLTGIHRKDVKRLRETPADDDSAPWSVSLGAMLVARWTGSDRYLDNNGLPIPLPRQSDTNAPSFDELVASVSKDIRSRVILDQWLDLGIVSITDDKNVKLNTRAFVPEKGFDELAYYFGRNLHDHVATAVHNISGNDPKLLERSVYYDKLSPESVETIRELATELAMDALQTINRRALEMQQNDKSSDNASSSFNFGSYFYRNNRQETDNE